MEYQWDKSWDAIKQSKCTDFSASASEELTQFSPPNPTTSSVLGWLFLGVHRQLGRVWAVSRDVVFPWQQPLLSPCPAGGLPAGMLLADTFRCSAFASHAGRAGMEAGGGEQRSRGPGEHLTRDSSHTDSALHAIAGTTQRAARGFSDTHAPPCSSLGSSFSQPSYQRHRLLLWQHEWSLLIRARGNSGRAGSSPCLCSLCSAFICPSTPHCLAAPGHW